MSKRKTPTARRGWSTSAKNLWRSVHNGYVLDEHHIVLLEECCEMLTRAAAARDVIERDGVVVEDRFGQPRPHPMIDSERQSVNSARLLLRELGLDFDGNSTSVSTANERVRIHRTKGYA